MLVTNDLVSSAKTVSVNFFPTRSFWRDGLGLPEYSILARGTLLASSPKLISRVESRTLRRGSKRRRHRRGGGPFSETRSGSNSRIVP